MKRTRFKAAFLTFLILAWCALSGASEAGRVYSVEENPVTSLTTYPYRVVSDSFELYLSQEDLEALDQDTYFEEMNRFLENLEEDLSEAREFLKDYLKEEVPPIRVALRLSSIIRIDIEGAGATDCVGAKDGCATMVRLSNSLFRKPRGGKVSDPL